MGRWNVRQRLLEVREAMRTRCDRSKTATRRPRWLADGADKKVRKSYANSKGLHVLLYANFETSALKYEDVHLALNPFSAHFASLWVITALDLCTVFSVPNLGEIGRWARIRTPEEASSDE